MSKKRKVTRDENKRTRERSGLDGGRVVLYDKDGNVYAQYVTDPEDSSKHIRLDKDGNQVVSTSIAHGSEYNGLDKDWHKFIGDWKFADEDASHVPTVPTGG